MSDFVSSHDEASTSEGFFEAVPDDASRVQEIKRILFDLTYLVMNADGTEHVSEKMLVRKLEN